MGTPEFAVPALIALIESKHDVAAVVTQPDRIKGRGKKMLPPPVKETAVNAGIPVMQPDKIKGNNDFLNELKEINPDIIHLHNQYTFEECVKRYYASIK